MRVCAGTRSWHGGAQLAATPIGWLQEDPLLMPCGNSVRDEAVKEKGLVSATALLDVVKAFECVRLDVIWQAGVKRGFPLVVLRLSLEAYCFARRLVYEGIVGDAIYSLNAILAGGGFATDLLSLLLDDTLTMLKNTVPGIHLYIAVDDLTLRAEGNEQQVSSMLVRATRLCVHQLEEELQMKVSRGEAWRTPAGIKSLALASSPGARALLTIGMRALGIPVKNQTRNLGVDYAPGRRARRKVVLLTSWKKSPHEGQA